MLDIDTPAASLSFQELSLSLGDQADVRLGKVVVLPHLLDVTQAWQADSVAATLSLRSGLVPEAVVVEGLKGELDLVALSDLATWLASEEGEPAAVEAVDPDVVELRRALNFGLSEVRGLLYGAALSVSTANGDVRLTYRDGTTLSLARLDLDIGPDRALASGRLLLTYEGQAERPEELLGPTRGSVEIAIRSLTPGRIADWTE